VRKTQKQRSALAVAKVYRVSFSFSFGASLHAMMLLLETGFALVAHDINVAARQLIANRL